MLNYWYWDISPSMIPWNLPILGRPVLWYGFFFALGFFLARAVFCALIQDRVEDPKKVADRLTLYILLGTLIGARLFDVIFYESEYLIRSDPLSIFKIWNGGLASHGGVLGLILASFVFQYRYPLFSVTELLDLISIPAGITAGCIRLGNFCNQEILGTPTTLPWAVIFGHPANRSLPTPRHPVQLYEALAYFILFLIMWGLRKRWKTRGRATGFFLTAVFGWRFWIECFKEEQSTWFTHSFLHMGHLLSIPFLLLGLYLLLRKSPPAPNSLSK